MPQLIPGTTKHIINKYLKEKKKRASQAEEKHARML